MKVLLDTHTFLWAINDPDKLSPKAHKVIASSERFWSVASIWESVIKVQLGKLPLPLPAGDYLVRQLRSNGVTLLSIEVAHALCVERLEGFHRDPFDRILIAQALEGGLPIVTADPVFSHYPVQIIW
ncbi:MAG TPA: type II toxin-antitoxin system VapC family toxin [Terriglobales bacterium]|nr:type II toxin-antitoxin system VapC family toxin [Terriglobales bacterium]